MVLEHALLDVDEVRSAAFEAAFAEAVGHIAGARGFRSVRLSRCTERPGRYLLLVEWDSVEDHVEGFRGSPAYAEWRRLLHHFYEPMPEVLHFVPVASA